MTPDRWRAYVDDAERSGPSRLAVCRLDDAVSRPCLLTPLFRDGSFDIVVDADTEYRVITNGERATAFLVFGPEKRVRLEPAYRRDKKNHACWVSGDRSFFPRRICVNRR